MTHRPKGIEEFIVPLFGKKKKPEFWKFGAKYLGGHAAFAKEAQGNLYLYPKPADKVVFESNTVNIEIPLRRINDTNFLTEKDIRARRVLLTGIIGFAGKKKHKMLVIDFKDQLGNIQSPIFEPDKIDEVASKLYTLRLETHSKF